MVRKGIKNLALVFLLFYVSLQAKETDPDMLLAKILTEVRPVDQKRAFYIVDSIYQNNPDVHVKVHALFINAFLYHDDFDIPNSLSKALLAIDLSERNKSYKWLSRLYGFVGAEYSRLELFTEAQIYFDKIESVLPKIDNEYDRIFSTYYYYHLLSSFYYQQKNYIKALESLHLGESYLNQISSRLFRYNHYLISNEQNKGINYLELKEFDRAREAYEKGLLYLNKEELLENDLTAGYIYVGLAQVYYQQRSNVSSDAILDYYLKGLHIATVNNSRDLKETTYYYLSQYYDRINDFENYSKYNKAYLQEKQAKENFRTTTVNELLEKQYIYKEEIKSKNKKYFIVILFFLVVLIIIPTVYFIRHKKIKKHLVNDITANDFLYSLTNTKEENLHALFQGVLWLNQSIEEGDKEVVEKLKKFEQTKGYLDSFVTIESLAKYCDTEMTNISYILRKYKNIDFKAYLSQYRLLEVIKLLRFEEKYRKYKIGHLAEIIGFGSHSSFTIEFKKIIGVNPSFFIQYLNEIQSKSDI
ncbi:helix-turn-helix domain-containing protein [Myroides sp. M-43]|uniref:AraC family transcriptional regulator n=1 Tax=Myroides oncorhynchi TaxID=2893756 RepID=UPI001E38FE02|nr:AraC family transcriptional regulator [Myroides oncorhynchi]MCC9044407.1 helix-turn-helix domain-containing protein [Myroides oncorhynchi]